MKYLLFILSLFAVKTIAYTQVNTVQPKIMVIPYTKEGEDLRTIFEEDFNKRIAISKAKKAFDNRGFTTVDFVGKIKGCKRQSDFHFR
ncbi:MAG: hypothetical protein IPN09_13330 [Bacteroidetes bacterium]|nr:hypothetical protein [Bacteroidota bacterium]